LVSATEVETRPVLAGAKAAADAKREEIIASFIVDIVVL